MKKLFLSAILALFLVPLSFAKGIAFDFFTGTGFSFGMFYGESLHWGYGFILDGHKSDYTVSDNWWGDSEGTENVTRAGAYYQIDYSFLPITIQRVKVGLNTGAQLGFMYTTLEHGDGIDMFLATFIGVEAKFKNISALMGWKGTGYLFESLEKWDDGNGKYTNPWKNAFLMGVRYTFKNSNSGSNSTGYSSSSSTQGSGGSSGTRIMSGSGVWSTH